MASINSYQLAILNKHNASVKVHYHVGYGNVVTLSDRTTGNIILHTLKHRKEVKAVGPDGRVEESVADNRHPWAGLGEAEAINVAIEELDKRATQAQRAAAEDEAAARRQQQAQEAAEAERAVAEAEAKVAEKSAKKTK